MTADKPPAAEPAPHASSAGRGEGGPLRRLLRRAVLALLHPELEETRRRAGELGERLGTVDERLGTVDERLGAVARDAGETREVLDDVRSAYLATRSEFEQVRDGRVPELARRLDALTSQEIAALQREMELLRDRRLPAAEQGIDGVHRVVQALQGELEAVRDSRLPELASRLDGLSRDGLRPLQDEIEALRDRRMPVAEADLEGLHGALVALQGEVARRLEEVETQRLPGLQAEVEQLRDVRLAAGEAEVARLHAAVGVVQEELGEVRDVRLARAETGLDGLQGSVEATQASLEEIRDTRLSRLEASVAEQHAAVVAAQAQVGRLEGERLARVSADLAGLQAAIDAVQDLAEEVRDARLPALARRTDVLVERLHEELTATAGLVDRLLAGEPLRVVAEPAVEAALPAAIEQASARFLAEFRGSEDEIAGRVREYVALLSESAPVLDLGCGRGELLVALREAGIEAEGVDADPAMVDSCRRRALAVERSDVLEAVRARGAETLGAVTAIHLLEHLPAANWTSVIEAAARALRPGGRLIVECPNPGALRVGGDLFWVDPTHVHPVHPDAVAFVIRAVGLTVESSSRRRPFPADQQLRRAGQSPEVADLAGRLDDWLSGPRDFVLVARK